MSDEHISKVLDAAVDFTAFTRWLRPFVLSLLAGAGIGLLLLTPNSRAAESSTEQNIRAEISPEISWGSANGCEQNIQVNNFGELTPEAYAPQIAPFDASPHATASTTPAGDFVWVGCVTTNTTLGSVTAQGLRDMSSSGHVLPLSDVHIGLTNAVRRRINGGFAGCRITANQPTRGACPLPSGGSADELVTEADPGTTELNWQYQLELPANQPVGDYTGGEVIFTATTGAAPSHGGGGAS